MTTSPQNSGVLASNGGNDQIADDLDLLQQMMDDLKEASPLYKPTNYWAYYEKQFLPELRRLGLRDLRRRRDSVLSSFGATDLAIKPQVKPKPGIRGVSPVARMLTSFFDRNPFLELGQTLVTAEAFTRYFHAHTKEKFERIRMDLGNVPASTCGKPDDLVEIEGLPWSRSHLQYCSMFADAARYIKFPAQGVLCELGPGMGRNIEVMAKLFEDATFLLFEIPPQLYVANQYLRTIFGPRVISYREAIAMSPASGDASIPPAAKGKILVLPTWRMPAWATTKVDVFWNSASFQEMEPDVVMNYLRLVISMKPEWIYINAHPRGCLWGDGKTQDGGSRVPVTESVYVQTLKDRYDLHCTYGTDYFLRPRALTSYIFARKQGTAPAEVR